MTLGVPSARGTPYAPAIRCITHQGTRDEAVQHMIHSSIWTSTAAAICLPGWEVHRREIEDDLQQADGCYSSSGSPRRFGTRAFLGSALGGAVRVDGRCRQQSLGPLANPTQDMSVQLLV